MTCSFLNCKVRIPLLETRVVLQSSVLTIGGENFRINNSDKTFFKSYRGKVLIKRLRTRRRKKYENSASSYCHSSSSHRRENEEYHSLSSNDVYSPNDLSVESGQMSFVEISTEEPNKSHDFQDEENFGSPIKYNASVSVRVPYMKPGELKGGEPIIRVGDEVFRVLKETREQIEKNDQAYYAPEMDCVNRIVSRKGFNSSSTFFEKEEKVCDRAYFHVFSTEMYGENEIYLNGVFVEDV